MSNGRRRGPRRRPRVIEVDRERFAAGWRLLPDRLAELAAVLRPPRRRPSIVVDVVRPADLVALVVEGYGLELVGGEAPVLRPQPGERAYLLVRLPFQHLAERAIYETPPAQESKTKVPDETGPDGPGGPPKDDPAVPDPPFARPRPPIPARPAKASRLVFEVAEEIEIGFSVEGILDALGRLPMAVHPLARPQLRSIELVAETPVLHLGGGLVARPSADGLVLTRTGRDQRPPDPSTAAGLAALARDVRRARAILARDAGVAVRLRGAAPSASPGTVRLGDNRLRIPGIADLVRPDIPGRIRRRPTFSRPARALETAIEAPFRLVISPSSLGGWSHARRPVVAAGAPHRVELWHSRLGVRVERSGAGEGDGAEAPAVEVDERASRQRIVRALWARDRELRRDWRMVKVWPHDNFPFRTSLDGADRHMLVRQSAETWLGVRDTPLIPSPVDAQRLFLSSLGAWLDLHGAWTTRPYSAAAIASILSWDHVAPMGRDQFVRVVYPGYLFPCGHRCCLVKITERKMKDAAPSVAGLYQRKFLVIGEPLRHYGGRDFPLTEVELAPRVTPNLDDPGNAQNSFFVPHVGGQPFPFVLHSRDQDVRPVRLRTPLLWVAEHYQPFADVERHYATLAIRDVPADGQEIAFAPVARGGDTQLPTVQLTLDGTAKLGTSTPRLAKARVLLPAVERLSPVGAVTLAYGQTYLDHGFGGAQNSGEVWAEISGAPALTFGASPAAGSDKAGGFLQPDLPIRGLSRKSGTVGDPAGMATQDFDPATFLAGAGPQLFGLVPLIQLVEAVAGDLSKAPTVVSETLDRIEGFLSDLERAKTAAAEAVADANRLVDRASAKAAEVQQKAQQAVAAAQQLQTSVGAAVDGVINAFGGLAGASEGDVAAALAAPLQDLGAAAAEMKQVAPQLPPLVRARLLDLAAAIESALQAADLIADVHRFLNGLVTGGLRAAFRFEWRPRVSSWPDPLDPILELPADSLVLAVDGRGGQDGAAVEVLAELRDFTLHLLPGAPLVRFRFDHLSFRAGSSGKAEVDVVLREIEFVGILAFIETLKELIPFDGFSDPPHLEVTPEGLTAGFSLGLPNVAVGVFSLSNISLGADVQVPFLGEVVTVGFHFCTRERPFALSVTFIGGGGWFLLRLSPDGLDLLELGLEAGASLSVDFGVASGSISAMLGIYMRLEGDEGSLTGYFRLRGAVDVMGLITASIELYLELRYEFDTGKMVGRATLTIKIEVLVFSGSVTISCERRFAGANGDPTFAEIMLLPDGTSPAWSRYCAAFAPEP